MNVKSVAEQVTASLTFSYAVCFSLSLSISFSLSVRVCFRKFKGYAVARLFWHVRVSIGAYKDVNENKIEEIERKRTIEFNNFVSSLVVGDEQALCVFSHKQLIPSA